MQEIHCIDSCYICSLQCST